MGDIGGHVLVVDDNALSRKMLARAVMQQGCQVTVAENGAEALALLRSAAAGPVDVMLLDILMPEMDGYQVLQQVKGDSHLHHLPVIMISALDEMDSVVRCIEMGATDYLLKPFNPALLRARLNASLAEKRLRDLELEYLEQVGCVVDAAEAVEAATFDPGRLDQVAAREDALGRLARVFQRMAREVHLREQRLKRQLEQLHLDMEEMKQALVEPLSVYLPMDRQHALVRGRALPDRTTGSALFADISGFTPLSSALERELGGQRGAEEMTRIVNRVFDRLIGEVHRYRGSVIGFSGDAITCWFDEDDGRRAIASATRMQEAMSVFASAVALGGASFPLTIKVAVAAGPVRRFLVGDPKIQVMEVIAGRTLDLLAAVESGAKQGEVAAHAEIIERAPTPFAVAEWHTDKTTGLRAAVVSGLNELVSPAPWPSLPADSLTEADCRAWVPAAVYEQIRSGNKQFISELRAATALCLSYRGIDYDGEEQAGVKLDAYIRWVQRVLEGHGGTLVNLSMGDKGSYLLAIFGAPVAHDDDASRAVRAAWELAFCPSELDFISNVQIGLAQGIVRAGSFGGIARRSYDVIGDKVNLAARLMMAATDGILCDESIYRAAKAQVAFTPLPPIRVKGRTEPVAVYRPINACDKPLEPADGQRGAIQSRLDRLSPSEQLTLKVASVIGPRFSTSALHAILPVDSEKARLGDHLQTLERLGLIVRRASKGRSVEDTYVFRESAVHDAAYNSMLFAQRRHLHRCLAEWCEAAFRDDLPSHYATLAHHWQAGDEPVKAMDYLEKAGQQAQQRGAYQEAERFLQQSLKLDAQAAVLSSGYRDGSAAEIAPDYDGAIRYFLSRLERDLAPELTYHNLWHTRDDVLPAARRLAAMYGLEEDQRRLLEVAAACHDIGFVVGVQEHERAGGEIVAQVLPGFGFTPEQVAAVQDMILATRLPQSPRTRLEEILCDADLDNLGRDDASARGEAVRAELAAFGNTFTDEEWYLHQMELYKKHRYFTAAEHSLRYEGRQKRIAMLEVLLAQARAQGGELIAGER